MKLWISKYALSAGITEHECEEQYGEWARPGNPFMSFVSFKVGRDAHTTRESAVAAAEAMRVKKIASLKKQIVKLEQMTF